MIEIKRNGVDRYVDILIVTALVEERFLLDFEFPQALNDVFGEEASYSVIETDDHIIRRVVAKISDGRQICIAWTSLGSRKEGSGNSMGNVYAYDACVRIAELLAPKFMLLLGIAGGSPSTFLRGDVGFGIKTGYSSYAKIEAYATLEEIVNGGADIDKDRKAALLQDLKLVGIDPSYLFPKYDLREVPIIDSSGTFCGIARNKELDTNVWVRLAASWFSAKNVKEFGESPFAKKYPPQCKAQRNIPIASPGMVASGDAIIANPALRESIINRIRHVDAHSKEDIRANMFEMESFGVGLFCRSRKIEFGMIKGICDLAGVGKDDQYRLCALSSASAFALSVITDRTFLMHILDSGGDRVGSGNSACIWPFENRSFERCVGSWIISTRNTLVSMRPCTNSSQLNVPDSTELLGARLFQQTESKAYSLCVKNLISERMEPADRQHLDRLILLFPYSVHDLLSFFRNTEEMNEDDLRTIMTLGKFVPNKNTKRDKLSHIRSLAISLGEKAYWAHPHFDATNRCCAKWIASGKHFSEVAERFCRVICIRDEDRRLLARDPRFLMHVFMNGLCIPTLIANSAPLGDFGADEATYFSRDSADGISSVGAELNARSVTFCLKYSDRSKLLALLGRCDSVPRPCAESKAFRMFEDIKEWLKANWELTFPPNPSGRYQVFPALRLLAQLGFGLQDALLKYPTLFPDYGKLNSKERGEVDRYFERLSAIE